MRPTVILSTTADPDYLFCLPIVAKSWELQGWHVHVIMCAKENHDFLFKYMSDYSITHKYYDDLRCDLNPALTSQVSRIFFPANVIAYNDEYMLLSDVDMFIGSNFLYRDFHKVNVFGHDLTGRNHIPICYVGATVLEWRKILAADGLNHVANDIERYCDLTNKQRAWTADQDILTGKLKAYGYEKVNFIDRGTDPDNHNLPIGRWDRYGGFVKPGRTVRDCHLPRKPYSDEEWPKIVSMCTQLYPGEDWGWLEKYREDFMFKPIVKELAKII